MRRGVGQSLRSLAATFWLAVSQKFCKCFQELKSIVWVNEEAQTWVRAWGCCLERRWWLRWQRDWASHSRPPTSPAGGGVLGSVKEGGAHLIWRHTGERGGRVRCKAAVAWLLVAAVAGRGIAIALWWGSDDFSLCSLDDFEFTWFRRYLASCSWGSGRGRGRRSLWTKETQTKVEVAWALRYKVPPAILTNKFRTWLSSALLLYQQKKTDAKGAMLVLLVLVQDSNISTQCSCNTSIVDVPTLSRASDLPPPP